MASPPTLERAAGLTELAGRAEMTAREAAKRAGVEVDLLHDLADLQDGADLLARVWGTSTQTPPVSRDLLRALVHAGNYVAGARSAGRLVGASVGFLGSQGHRVVLHSHITGVAIPAQGHAAGFALKQHQRAWALRHGLTEITWTFDPLVRRNGYFNLTKLRARVVAYLPDFYGEMGDLINAGDESDRCLALWSLTDPAVVAASSGPKAPERPDAGGRPPGTVVLAEGGDGRPVSEHADGVDGVVLAAQVPSDIVATRRAAPGLAVEWRHALRRTFGCALEAGYEAVGMTRDGWYALERAPAGETGR